MLGLILVGLLQTQEWGEPIAGLRSRIDVVRKGDKDGSPKLVTYLSLENVTDSLGTIDVYLSIGNLVLWLEDKAGNKLEMSPSGLNGRNGFVPSPFWLQIPFDTTIRMRTDLTGYFSRRASELVIESESGLLAVPKGWKKPVYLAGKFEIVDPPHEARSRRWEGTMGVPRILIFDGRKLVAGVEIK